MARPSLKEALGQTSSYSLIDGLPAPIFIPGQCPNRFLSCELKLCEHILREHNNSTIYIINTNIASYCPSLAPIELLIVSDLS